MKYAQYRSETTGYGELIVDQKYFEQMYLQRNPLIFPRFPNCILFSTLQLRYNPNQSRWISSWKHDIPI